MLCELSKEVSAVLTKDDCVKVTFKVHRDRLSDTDIFRIDAITRATAFRYMAELELALPAFASVGDLEDVRGEYIVIVRAAGRKREEVVEACVRAALSFTKRFP